MNKQDTKLAFVIIVIAIVMTAKIEIFLHSWISNLKNKKYKCLLN